MSRARSVGLLVLAAAAAAAILWLATVPTVTTATAPGADAGAMIAGLALIVAWGVTLRLAVTVLAVCAGALPGVVGQRARRIALAWSPRFARGLVHAALGVTVAAGPMLSGAAAFADQPVFPALDRMVVSAAPPVVTVETPSLAPGRTVATPPPRAVPPPPAHRPAAVVVVRPGDTLWAIAARALPSGHSDADVARAWPRWYAANRTVIGPDPGQIRPGQHLVAPG